MTKTNMNKKYNVISDNRELFIAKKFIYYDCFVLQTDLVDYKY